MNSITHNSNFLGFFCMVLIGLCMAPQSYLITLRNTSHFTVNKCPLTSFENASKKRNLR